MTTTYTAAYDEMCAMFQAAWDGAASVVGYVPEIFYSDAEKGWKPPRDKYWCRLTMRSVFENQATVSTCDGEGGWKKRYRSVGNVFVQLFGPTSDTQAKEKMQKLAVIARDAYRGKSSPGSIWFRNARINNIPKEEEFYRYNVVADYQFDELGG